MAGRDARGRGQLRERKRVGMCAFAHAWSGARAPRAPRVCGVRASAGGARGTARVLHPVLGAASRASVRAAVGVVDAVYGAREDAFRRFYVLEVMARIPFFAYTCLLHLRETVGGPSEDATARLRAHFEQADNEALHLAVMVCMGGGERWGDRVVAAHLSVAYFFVSAVVFLASPPVAFYFSELVELHAYDTYDRYLRENEALLRDTMEVPLVARAYYAAEDPPRLVASMYDVLSAIRDDERHHSDALHAYGADALRQRPL